MSNVTNLLLSFGILEDEINRIAEINAYWDDDDRGFTDVADSLHCGGTKAFELPLWGGAFNHLKLDDFMCHLRTVRWVYPDLVRVIVAEQHDHAYWMLPLDREVYDRKIEEPD